MSIPAGFKALPISLAQVSLDAVLKCGQSFRWSIYPLASNATTIPATEPTHEYRLTLKDRVICLRQSPSHIFYRAVFPDASVEDNDATSTTRTTLEWIRDYFQLEVDLEKLYAEWCLKDDVFKLNVNERFRGIRILRQDPWENVVSFICSSNNNIGRITKMVQSLCTEFSPPLLSLPIPSAPEQSKTYHPFPPPSKLADPSVAQRLRELGFGYRAEYVQRTAQFLCEEHTDPLEFLAGLRVRPVDEARTELIKLHGVGPKVADCILLMSMNKHAVVPVDTHVHQIAIKHYAFRTPGASSAASSKSKIPMTPKIYEAVAKKFVDIWGDYAGWAHSVLFTADLKSFASYNVLPTPESTPSRDEKVKMEVEVKSMEIKVEEELVVTPTKTKKRKTLEVMEEIVIDRPHIKRQRSSRKSVNYREDSDLE